MMGLEYFNVAAYTTEEGDILCVRCGEDSDLPADRQVIEANICDLVGDAEYGLYCDRCGNEIIEPIIDKDDEEEEYNSDEEPKEEDDSK
jgi:hypothetical protein